MTGGSGNPGAPAATPKPKLLQQVRDAIRRKHFSPRTEESYVHWIKRFVFFSAKRRVREEKGQACIVAYCHDRHPERTHLHLCN